MSTEVTCPDCHSQDVQMIEKNQTVITKGGTGWRAIIRSRYFLIYLGAAVAGVFLLILLGALIGAEDVFGPLSSILLVVSYALFYILRKRKLNEETKNAQVNKIIYYVCRSCGKEFRNT